MRKFPLPTAILVLVIVTGIITSVGRLLYCNQRDSCRMMAECNLAAIADLKVNQLAMWRTERLADANVFFKNDAFTALVRRCVEDPQDVSGQKELRTWLNHFRMSNSYDRVVLFDAAGKKWLMFEDMTTPPSATTDHNVHEALRVGRPIFTDFYPGARTQQIRLRLFVPILDEQADNRPLGVLMLGVDPNVVLYPLIQWWPMPEQTGEALLVQRQDGEAVVLNEPKSQKHTALPQRVSLDRSDLLPVKAVLNQNGIVEAVNGKGVPVLAAVRAVPASPWLLATQMDTAEVYAPLREVVWLTVLFVCAVLLGVTGTMVALRWGIACAGERLLLD